MVSRRPTTDGGTRTFEERIKLYEKVMTLAQRGYPASHISKTIRKDFGIKLAKQTISDWVNERGSPYGRVYSMPSTPMPELAYVIGVRFSDGSRSESTWHHNHKIILRVTDKEYAEEFARSVGAVLGRSPYELKWNPKRSMWHVEANSMLLYKFLDGGLIKFKPFIEHCRECTLAFLRAFFDGEGSSGDGGVSCSNNNIEVLRYVKALLGRLGIEARGPFPHGPVPGTLKNHQGSTLQGQQTELCSFSR